MFTDEHWRRRSRAYGAAARLLPCASLLVCAAASHAASIDTGAAPPPAPVKDIGRFDAAVFFPLSPGASWRYTLADVPPVPFRLAVSRETRRIEGIRTTVLEVSGTGTRFSYTADDAGLRLHQEVADNGASLTYAPPLVLVEPGSKTGAVRRRSGSVRFASGDQRLPLNYDTRSEVVGTQALFVDGIAVNSLRVRTQVSIFGAVNGTPLNLDSTTERWLVPHVGMARERVELNGERFDSTLDSAFVDGDRDGISALEDNCPAARNADQRDTDRDGSGDACDADDDNDGAPDITDEFPTDPGEQTDHDGDTIGDNADLDDDNDGLGDAWERRFGFDPLDAADARLDADGDGRDNLAEFQAGSNPRLNEALLLPVLIDLL